MSDLETAKSPLHRLLSLLDDDAPSPVWARVNSPDVPPFREDAMRAHLKDAPLDLDDTINELRREAFDRLHHQGLIAASERAAAWIGEGHLSWTEPDEARFEIIAPVNIRSATRVHQLDAVLYVDGIALALIVTGSTAKQAIRHMERLEEACPAWFVTPALLVALGDDDAAVTAPGILEERWHPTDIIILAELLRPLTLVRIARFDAVFEKQAGGSRRTLLAPTTLLAVEYARLRVLSSRDGLLSIAEGAGEYGAVRALVARLLGEHLKPVVLAATIEIEKRLFGVLAEFKPLGAWSPPQAGSLTLSSPGELADLREARRPIEVSDRAVIAFGIDAGFRGEQGFAARMLLPDTPWISLTCLPPDAVEPEVLHAFADPHDEDGFLDVVDIAKGRVPIREERCYVASDRFADAILPHIPRSHKATSLILVGSPVEATAMAAALSAAGVQVLDATKWGRANDGWRLLAEPKNPVVVVRNSLPFWNSVPHLTAAFVMRGISRTTLARLRNILSRPQPEKTEALLFVSAQLVDLNPSRRA